MRVVAKFDDLEEWKQYCNKANFTIENQGEYGWVCYDKWHNAFNPNGWFDEGIQVGEVDFLIT